MKVVAISDTHTQHNKIVIPECDILIHAGDATYTGTLQETLKFLTWFSNQPALYKIYVEGNHDFLGERSPGLLRAECKERKIILLNNQTIELEGLVIHGSPITPTFLNWAHMADRGEEISRYWDMIPAKVDVLITHGPPYGVQDQLNGESLGCKDLYWAVAKVRPSYHIFGHIHNGYGYEKIGNTLYCNVSICNEAYEPSNKPTVLYIAPLDGS